jgi:type II secretion system protein G
MINKFRVRVQSEKGFTLVELLVVMLILGLLAAIAIPSFFNQRDKARDADAKASVRTAQTAMETYATDNGNDGYDNASAAILEGIEETLVDADLSEPTVGTAVGDDAVGSYLVEVTSSTGENAFQIERHNNGSVELTCTTPTAGEANDGCRADGTWGD